MRFSWRTIELQCKRAGCLVLVLMLMACQAPGASLGPRTPFDAERDFGTVAIVALPFEPQVELKGFASGKGSGALGTAGGIFASCIGHGGSMGGCSGGGSLGGAICGAALLIWLGACTVGTGVGAIAGATMSDTAGSVQANVATINSSLDAQKIQEGLRDQVANAAAEARVVMIATPSADTIARAVADKNYRALAAAGVDNVIETSLTKIGTMGRGFDPPITLYMLAHVRIINTQDNSERFASNHSYVSEQHLLREWAADHGALLQRGLQTGFMRLGSSIADRILREYSFPSRESQDKESIGLAAVYPKTTASSRHLHLDRQANWNEIESLRPTLQWQSFPREADRVAAPEQMARVRDVRYDILVAEEMGMAPGAVVASAYGIEQTSYRVEQELQPSKKYFWTVRATFELDGKRRVTPWAIASSGMAAVAFKVIDAQAFPQIDALRALAQPSAASYRFQTGLAPSKSSEPVAPSPGAVKAVLTPAASLERTAAVPTAANSAGQSYSSPRLGDTWTYNVLNGGQKADTLQVVVTGVTETQLTESITDSKSASFKATRIFGLSFNPAEGFQETELPGRFFLAEFSPYVCPSTSQLGKTWEGMHASLTITLAGKVREDWRLTAKVVGTERIRVPAGEFEALKVEVVSDRHRWADSGDGIVRMLFWYAPEAKRTVKMVRRLEGSKVIVSYTDVYELVSYKLN